MNRTPWSSGQTTNSSARPISQRLGPGRRAKHVKAQNNVGTANCKARHPEITQSCWRRKRSRHVAKHVPRADLDKLSDALKYWFLDEENMKATSYPKVCDEH